MDLVNFDASIFCGFLSMPRSTLFLIPLNSIICSFVCFEVHYSRKTFLDAGITEWLTENSLRKVCLIPFHSILGEDIL